MRCRFAADFESRSNSALLPSRSKILRRNNDTRTHNIRVFHPDLDFDSGAQEPGETVEIAFPDAGSFLVFCGIHPKMELNVDVATIALRH